MIERNNWWATPIWVKDYTKEEVDHTQIEKLCYSIKEQDNGVIHSNMGGWQSNDINEKQFGPLYNHLQKDLIEIFKDYSVKKEYIPIISQAWININKNEDYNTPHVHPGCFLSAVYYVKGSETGNIIFRNNSINRWLNGPTELKNDLVCDGAEYKAITNRLIVFPSWIEHEVKATMSKEDRISIAFNILLAPTINSL
jgi:uncharacterized protein (TIGR02466 family)